jgi:hypothetical protein
MTTSDWISIVQTIILVGAVYLAYVQLRSLARGATSVAYQGLVELWAEYRRLFLQKQGLYSALFPEYGREDNDATHLGKLLLDMVDNACVQRDQGTLTEAQWPAWEAMIRSIFFRSPKLRDLYRELRDSYTGCTQKVVDRIVSNSASPQQASSCTPSGHSGY